MQYISRAIEGWNVRMTRNGKRHSKFFGDARYGGKTKARAAARVYRDELMVRRSATQKRPTPRPITVVRGSARYCQIRLPTPGGGTKTTEFSIVRHGVRGARRLAIEAFGAAQAAVGV